MREMATTWQSATMGAWSPGGAMTGANWVTAVRTAALSAVAAKRLADPASHTIAFVGTGVQAHSHLDAFSALFPIKRIHILGRGQSNIDRLIDKAQTMGFEAKACATPKEALSDADIVVTSVTLDYAITPFLDAGLLKPNAFAAITDLCIPWLPDSMSAFKTIYVDDRTQEAESAKPMLPYDQIDGDLTDLVVKEPKIGAHNRPAAFAFRGIALGDYAAAVLALRRAEASGAGLKVGG